MKKGYMHSIFFLHGKGGSSEGSVKSLKDALAINSCTSITLLDFPSTTAQDYYTAAVLFDFPKDSLLVGVSLGGLIAAKLLQDIRPDLTVVTLASPTYSDDLFLKKQITPNLYALYSHNDPVVGDRTDWENFTTNYADIPWMADHNIDSQRYSIASVLSDFIENGDFKEAVNSVNNIPNS